MRPRLVPFFDGAALRLPQLNQPRRLNDVEQVSIKVGESGVDAPRRCKRRLCKPHSTLRPFSALAQAGLGRSYPPEIRQHQAEAMD